MTNMAVGDLVAALQAENRRLRAVCNKLALTPWQYIKLKELQQEAIDALNFQPKEESNDDNR